VVRAFGRVVAPTGLRSDSAAGAGYSLLTASVTADDHKAYYPGATPIYIRITR
jgi:hypothetical protein